MVFFIVKPPRTAALDLSQLISVYEVYYLIFKPLAQLIFELDTKTLALISRMINKKTQTRLLYFKL